MTMRTSAVYLCLGVVPALLLGQAKAKIVAPKQGATVTGSTVHVVLASEGVVIAPVADKKPGTAHYHLFLDTNLTPVDSAIPIGVPGMWHLGKGQSEYDLEVAPGSHRLIVELADPLHVPLKNATTDTIRFSVKP
jgi:hypothetical protein